MGPEVVNASRKALTIRYELLPYYYTLFYKAHMIGSTVARPLFHEYIFKLNSNPNKSLNLGFLIFIEPRFTRDNRTYSIDRQFLIGPAFLVTPVLEQGAVLVDGYFPASHWYDYYSGDLVVKFDDNGTTLSLNAPIDHIPLHIRGGYILPTQKPAINTAASRLNPFGLIVAPDENGEARGDLFYDDGHTDIREDRYFYATLYLSENRLVMNVEKNNYSEMSARVLDTVRIFTPRPLRDVDFIVNGNETVDRENIRYEDHQVVLVNLGLRMSERIQIEWSVEAALAMSQKTTLIDCSPQDDDNSVSMQECVAKGCHYEPSYVLAPKCSIPLGLGGYKLKNDSAQGDVYDLVKADNFTLFPKCVRDLRVEISYGKIEEEFSVTRIKVAKL